MGLLTLQDVSITYGDRLLLRGVSMVVGEADRIGILGPNGSGKTTLLRILAGVEVPDHGQRTVRRDLRVGYLEQDPQLPAGLTVQEAVRVGQTAREAILRELECGVVSKAHGGSALQEVATDAALEVEDRATQPRPGPSSSARAPDDLVNADGFAGLVVELKAFATQ